MVCHLTLFGSVFASMCKYNVVHTCVTWSLQYHHPFLQPFPFHHHPHLLLIWSSTHLSTQRQRIPLISLALLCMSLCCVYTYNVQCTTSIHFWGKQWMTMTTKQAFCVFHWAVNQTNRGERSRSGVFSSNANIAIGV